MTLYMAIDDPEEIAEHYQEEYNKVRVPGEPVRPVKQFGQSHESYGKQLDEYEISLIEYRDSSALYKQERDEIFNRFKKDLLGALGISSHPKCEKAWEMAWRRKGRDGFTAFAKTLEELTEIM